MDGHGLFNAQLIWVEKQEFDRAAGGFAAIETGAEHARFIRPQRTARWKQAGKVRELVVAGRGRGAGHGTGRGRGEAEQSAAIALGCRAGGDAGSW